MAAFVWFTVVLLVTMAAGGSGHARLLEPPSRASAWRLGWPTPIDYQDNEGFCGGFSHQYYVNDGQCGVCGDPWDQMPREHEAPDGKYATGTLVRQYIQGQVLVLTVEVTANHRGHFEVRICPDLEPEATQDCLDANQLLLADGFGNNFNISFEVGKQTALYLLPPTLTCTHCVLQWRYVTGNNWGICQDGTGSLGCGPQEEFRACADVSVLPPSPRSRLAFRAGLKPSPASLKPSPASLKPSPASLKPSPASLKPSPASLKPSPVSLKPSPASLKPSPASLKPSPVSLKPSPASLKPSPVSLKPSPVSLKPSSVSLKPSPASLKPSPASLKPSPASLKPSPVSLKPSPASLKPSPASLKPSPASLKPSPASASHPAETTPSHPHQNADLTPLPH